MGWVCTGPSSVAHTSKSETLWMTSRHMHNQTETLTLTLARPLPALPCLAYRLR